MSQENRPILVVTGETSGEQHAAGLIRQIKKQYPDHPLRFLGCGGHHMAKEGVHLLLDVSQLAIIGTWEAIINLPNYLALYRELLVESARQKPRLAILVDFPDFNLRLARKLKKLGIPVCYFIGPQVWAWKRYRVRQIKRRIDLFLVIFPFEEQFYSRHGIKAHYIGNPTNSTSVLTTSKTYRRNNQKFKIALLPGSRQKEVELNFPIQLDAAQHVTKHCAAEFWVSKAPNIKEKYLSELYEKWLSQGNPSLPIQIRQEKTTQLLSKVDCALIKSGTSTLEATILQVPFVMMYCVSKVSWYLMRPLVRTQTYCLANLIAGKRIVPEFIQKEATGDKIGDFLLTLLKDEQKHKKMQHDLKTATLRLGEKEAYAEGAQKIIERFLQQE